MPIGTAIIGAIGGAIAPVANLISEKKARKDRDALIEDELRFQREMAIIERESALLDPTLYETCIDQYESTGGISELCQDAGFTRSKIAQKSAEKSEKTKKTIGGVVIGIVLLIVVYFLIIKN